MKTPSRYWFAACLVLLAGGVGCSKSKDPPKVVAVAQDTMLLRDLAEANKNTAAAAALDNSLTTVRTTGDQTLTPSTSGTVATSTPVTRVVPRPVASNNGGPVAPSVPPSDTSIIRVAARHAARTRPKPSASSGDPCDSPDPVDQRSCLNRSIVQNDADLNQTYQELLGQARKSGGSGLEDRFRQTQREWINTRDSNCQSAGQGALWARARARCLADYSSKRTAELQRSLSSLRGQ
ncbi:MAG: lysozyme inhibitor LprI family protein [Gemmatimonadaceae bacterium]